YFNGWVNADVSPQLKTDVCWDLDEFPWPFKDGEFDLAYNANVLEHVKEPVKFINECHRVLKKDGYLVTLAPHSSDPQMWSDFTHLRGLNIQSFQAMFKERWQASENSEASGSFAEIVEKRLLFRRGLYYFWNYLMEPIANWKPEYWENTLGKIFTPPVFVVVMKK
ncbi:MAG TPA: class I SAM-dependent methyltransferase, partial [archaeon]|nr:class I SAM-dependent methyltransferase [archaeon]